MKSLDLIMQTFTANKLVDYVIICVKMIQENHNSVSILDTLSHYDSQNLLVVTRHVRQALIII